MKIFYMKVRDKFIKYIVNGIKKNEFRLATPERRDIKIGDTLVLISNSNKKNYITVSVNDTKMYSNWESVINENWADFSYISENKEDVLKECKKFYTKEEIQNFGIIGFSIKPIKVNYNSSNVLLDTNIIIKRESQSNVSFEVANLFKWFSKKHIQFFIHPKSIEEINGYKDEQIRSAILTKLNAYNTLPSFSNFRDEHFQEVISKYSQDENSKVDNCLLNEIYNENIDILLTDDKQMLRKAEELYIRDRVISTVELLKIYEKENPQEIDYKMLSVKLKQFKEIDLGSNFFDSLREDYGGAKFDQWFKKKALKKEKAYVFEDEGSIKGFLYVKIENEDENYNDISPVMPPKKRLKVGTFKIEKSSGFRLGERFLKIIFDNAYKNKVQQIYVTLFEEKRSEVRHLKILMEDWGFVKYGKKSNGETVMLKDLTNYDRNKSPKFNFPIVQKEAKKYFLPILPQYHTDLFPDMILNNEDMHLYQGKIAHRYALEKIYLTGAYNIQAKTGDIILIYRNGDRCPKKFSSVVTGLAIINEIIHTKNVDECIKICKNKSIFSEQEIRKNYDNYPTIVKLIHWKTFNNKITLNKLYDLGIIETNKGPRPFTEISNDDYKQICILGMEE